LAALGNRRGDVEGIVRGVDRGQQIGEVWLKLEELFPQATILIQTLIDTEITFVVDPVQQQYWETIKHLIPLESATVVRRGSLCSVGYFEINPITEGAFIWTTQQ
jgi:hypothetical protein